uniref:Non-homologous end joining protein Ku n=1 Tax=Desulfobacca acetoxidans TaxID=60893 RepID=A0A7C3ZCQ5_9BACT
MKAIWKGYLKCSLVTIPVKLYHAVIQKTPRFELLHRECGTKIKQERVCPKCQRPLSQDEIIRGYRYGKDMYVEVTDDDLRRAEKEATDTIEIVRFVDAAQIQPIYYADSHYLAPDGPAGVEALALFLTAMAETGTTALARLVLRNREHLLALRPDNGTLLAFSLHYPAEIVPADSLEELADLKKVTINAEGLALAKTIIQHLRGDFIPQDYHDEYTETLLHLIKAKAAGEEFRVEPQKEVEKVVSLMDALKKSVAAAAGQAAPPKKGLVAAAKQPRKAKAEAAGGKT